MQDDNTHTHTHDCIFHNGAKSSYRTVLIMAAGCYGPNHTEIESKHTTETLRDAFNIKAVITGHGFAFQQN